MALIRISLYQQPASQQGLTLFEVLMAVALLSTILLGLQRVLSTSLDAYATGQYKQDLLNQASYALERMARFVRETDSIVEPGPGNQTNTLKISERILDTFNNENQDFAPEGDDYLDADNDHDGQVNEDATDDPDAEDPHEYVVFSLSGDQLREEIPDYSTTALDDTTGPRTICDHVSGFQVLVTNATNSTTSTLVEIRLDLETGGHELTLKTRVRPGFIE